MTISSSANRNDYTGNDTTATYNYSYKIFAEGDLTVTVRNTTTGVETTLTITTDYTVTGVGETSGGTIVLVDAGQAWISASSYLDTGYALTIRREVDLTQETDIRNQGDFYPEAHEDQFDKLVMADQQQQDEINRSVKLPETISSSVFDPTLPTTITTGSLSLVINEAGTGFETGPTTTEISNAQTYATNAASSATAASNSATAAAASASAAATSETNAATSESNAASSASAASTSATNAATSETNAASSASSASTSATNAAASAASAASDLADIEALLSPISTKEAISDSQTNTPLTATIDETTHYSGVFQYFVTRGSTVQYGRLLIIDQAPFTVTSIEKVGDAGVSFDIAEAGGVGTLNYTSNAIGAGNIRYKFVRFEV